MGMDTDLSTIPPFYPQFWFDLWITPCLVRNLEGSRGEWGEAPHRPLKAAHLVLCGALARQLESLSTSDTRP